MWTAVGVQCCNPFDIWGYVLSTIESAVPEYFLDCLSPGVFRIPNTYVTSAWIEHTPFAMWLVEALKPKCVVELGTHHGVSYFTFCETAMRLGASTRCFAVDTWEGDEHAGFYGEDVWNHVSKINAAHYAAFSTLIRQTFDSAIRLFEDGSIDLLHIDGRHYYDDVRHDFQAWLPKLSDAGVVILHDTNVHERGFGVAQLWRELQQVYPTFEFFHGNGLGVVAVGSQPPHRLKPLLSASADLSVAVAIRSAYARLGAGIGDRLALQNEEMMVARLRGDVAHLQRAAESAAASARAEVQAARAEVQAAEAKVGAQAREIHLVTAQRDQLLKSTSWRMTAPLRWVSRASHLGRALLAARRLGKDGPIEALRKVKRFIRRRLRMHTPAEAGVVDPRAYAAVAMSEAAPCLAYQPLISIVVPVFNVEPELLRRAVASVQAQTYPNWELCVCDDGSTAANTIDTLLMLERTEPRLRLVRLARNSGISGATNKALALANGDFVAFLDNDDELIPFALEKCVVELNRDDKIDVLYSDEDKLNHRGEREEPFFKPDWSPSLLREVMYVGHLLVVRCSLVKKIGGCDSTYDGVQDFELMLRLSEHTRSIKHVREILYHWRRIPGSVADRTDAKPHLSEKQVAAVNAHLSRLGISAHAVQHPSLEHRVIVKPLGREHCPRVSIVILTKDAPQLISQCLDSIYTKTNYPDFEVVVVDNETTDREAQEAIGRHPVIHVPFKGNFNFSRANNRGVAVTSGEILVLLNNDTEIIDGDWLNEMLFLLDDPEVAAVGPMLLYPDGTVQHAGVALGIRGTADHVLRGLPADADGYFGSLACTREVSAVTFACVMMRRGDYDAVGGLQELYGTHYQDVDFCLRLRERGRRILYTPRTRLIHHESATRGSTYDAMDRALLLDAWGTTISFGDPYSRWEPAARAEVRAV
jgi:GT2 family glycosyltransferase